VVPYLLWHGRYIHYSYVEQDWPAEAYQTVFTATPGSAEMPSASRPFTTEIITRLVVRGVTIAPITLHTGVSSLEGDEEPYPEPFDVPPATARLVNMTRQAGGRVIAVGTTVVRALESAALNGPGGELAAASGWTHHVVTPETGVHVVDGLFTGLHEPRSSHLHMLNAFAGEPLLRRCYGRSAPFCLPRGRFAGFGRLVLGAGTPQRPRGALCGVRPGACGVQGPAQGVEPPAAGRGLRRR